jgi:hypothetical protein
MSGRGAPPPRPDFLSTPVQHGEGFRVAIPAGGNPTSPAQIGAALEIHPWWLYEYASAQDWTCKALAAAIGASGITVLPTTFAYAVPTNYIAVVKSVTIVIIAPTTAMNLSFTLLKNNGPVQGWSNRMMPPGSGSAVTITYNNMILRMAQGETLTAQFLESGGATWSVSVEASGWQVLSKDVERIQQGFNY